jgi:hypothetical protein
VHVEVREVPFAERHEVAARAEVRLDVLELASVLLDREAQLGALVGETHLVAVLGRGPLGRLGERPRVEAAGHAHVGPEGVGPAAAVEVREDAVAAGIGEAEVHLPGAVLGQPRVHMLIVAHVAPDRDEVHLPLVLDLEVGHGAITRVDDAEAEGRRVPGRQLGDEAQSVVGDR